MSNPFVDLCATHARETAERHTMRHPLRGPKAMGHVFNYELNCRWCGVSIAKHWSEPRRCTKAPRKPQQRKR